MLCCEKIKRIDIRDMDRLKSIYGYRRELLIYQNSFIFIHNNKVRVFSLDDLKQNICQIINVQNIKQYLYSNISHIDSSLFIAQSNDVNGNKSYIKQYILDNESLELKEIDTLEINGRVKDIFNYRNGYIIETNVHDDIRYILLYQ